LNVLFPLFPIEGMPAAAIYIGVVEGIAGLVGAAGLWLLRKWGFWLTIVVSVLDILDAVPGILFAPNAALQFAATVTVLGLVLVIVLVALPTSRHAFTSF
jgi:Flp pilus assembly protein protease CpaA